MTTPDYGNDTSTFDAAGRLSMGFDRPEITGVRVILEGCVRTIMTPLGSNADGTARGLPYDTSQGVLTTVQKILNTTPTDADLRRIEADWSVACKEQVEYVTAARWRILRDTGTGSGTGKLLRIVGTIDVDGSGTQVVTGTLAGSAADALAFLFPTAGG